MKVSLGPNYDAHETIVVSTKAKGLTAGTFTPERIHALITVEGGAVRFWPDGTDPTNDVGHVLEKGDELDLNSQWQLKNIRFIRRDDDNATLSCSYGR